MGTIDMKTIGRLARAALAAGEPYLFGRVVPVLAGAAPGNPEWMVGYLRVLGQLGLFDAARGIMDQLDDGIKRDPAVVRLVDAFGSESGGRIPWSSRRRRFDANLRALARRDAEAADAIRQRWAEACELFEWHSCKDGNHQVRDVSTVWPPRWIPALDDHRGQASGLVDTGQNGILPPPLLFDCVGLGWEILDGYKRTRRVFLEASAVVYVVERSYDAMGIVFHLHDWREMLGDESVHWLIGDQGADRLRELLERDTRLPVTDRYCFSNGLTAEPDADLSNVMVSVNAARQRRAEELQSELAARYANRDAAYWARRFAEGINRNGSASDRPLRILGVTSLHTTFLQHSMRDSLSALRKLGNETRLLIESEPYIPLDPVTCLEAELDFEPDLVLLLSRMRYEMTSIISPAIPAVTWDQDALPWVFEESRNPRLEWNDFLVGMAAKRMGLKFGWPDHRCRFCEMAGATDTYQTAPLTAQDIATYGCDISYVSNASASPEQEALAVESWLPDKKLIDVFRRVIPKVLPGWLSGSPFPGPTMPIIVDTCRECSQSCSNEEIAKINQTVHRVGDRAFRHVALEWVADWADRTGRKLLLWGNGWKDHPRFGRYAQGPTQNGDELRKVYQASTINLQLIGFGFLHQRAFDGLVASGFFLTRRSDADEMRPLYQRLMELFEKHSVTDAHAVSVLADNKARRAIEVTLAKVGLDHRLLDHAMVETLRLNAENEYAADIVPHFDEITFSTADEFAARADRFLEEPDRRAGIASDMREAITGRFSYESRMKEIISFVRDGFAIQSSAAPPVAGPSTNDYHTAHLGKTPPTKTWTACSAE